MRKTTFLAFVLPMLCGACVPAADATLPVCSEGEFLGATEQGVVGCLALDGPGRLAPLPVCSSSEALTADAQGVHCVKRSNVDDLDKLRADLTQLQELVSRTKDALNVRPASPGVGATFVGLTSATSLGRIDDQMGLVGVTSATRLCERQYGAFAHLCSVYEMYRSAALGAFANQTVARSWIYFPAWNTVPTLRNADLYRGLGDTCGGYIVLTSSDGYRGAQVEWKTLSTGAPGLSFHTGDDARCVYMFPLACCR